MVSQPNIPTTVTLVSDAVEYFSDSHNIQIMDDNKTNVQKMDSEVPVKRPSEPGPRKLISDALRSKLADGEADKLAAELLRIGQEGKNSSDRIAAIAEITDRTEGKAIQSIRHAGVFMVAAPSAEAIAALDGWATGDE